MAVSGYGIQVLEDGLLETKAHFLRIAQAYQALGKEDEKLHAEAEAEAAYEASNALPVAPADLTQTATLAPSAASVHFFWNDLEPVPPPCGVVLGADDGGEIVPCDELVEKEEEVLQAPSHECGGIQEDAGSGEPYCPWTGAPVDAFYAGEKDPATGDVEGHLIEMKSGGGALGAGDAVHPCFDRVLKTQAHCWEMTEGEFLASVEEAVNGAATAGGEAWVKQCEEVNAGTMEESKKYCAEHAPAQTGGVSPRELKKMWEKVRQAETNTVAVPDYDCFSLYDLDPAASPIEECPTDANGACTTAAEDVDLFLKCSYANSQSHIGQILHDIAYSEASAVAAQPIIRRLLETADDQGALRRLLEEENSSSTLRAPVRRFEHRSPARRERRRRLEKRRQRGARRERRRRLAAGEPTTSLVTTEPALLDRVLQEIEAAYYEEYYDYEAHSYMYAQELAWEKEYEEALKVEERRLVEDPQALLTAMHPQDFTQLLTEVRYQFFANSGDANHACAILANPADAGFTGLSATEQEQVEFCVAPTLGGVSAEIVEMLHEVKKGWQSPADLLSYLSVDTPDPSEGLAKEWANNYAAFDAVHEGGKRCGCVCKRHSVFSSTPLTGTACGNDVFLVSGSTVGICDYYKAAEDMGYIDLSDCLLKDCWDTPDSQCKRRLEVDESVKAELEKEEELECVPFRGEEYCKPKEHLPIIPELENQRRSLQAIAEEPAPKLTKKQKKWLKRISQRRGRKGSFAKKRHSVNEKERRKRQLQKFRTWKKKKGIRSR